MSLPPHWLDFCPARATARMKVVIRGFTERTRGCRPTYSKDRYGILYQITSNSINLLWWSSRLRRRRHGGHKKIARTGLIWLEQDCLLDDTPLFHGEEEREKKGGRTFAEVRSVPPHRLSNPISDWNYLWTGINRSFDYEPGFAQKGDKYDINAVDEPLCSMEVGNCSVTHIPFSNDRLQLWVKQGWDLRLLYGPEFQAWLCPALRNESRLFRL